jgi:hypothetical protein
LRHLATTNVATKSPVDRATKSRIAATMVARTITTCGVSPRGVNCVQDLKLSVSNDPPSRTPAGISCARTITAARVTASRRQLAGNPRSAHASAQMSRSGAT